VHSRASAAQTHLHEALQVYEGEDVARGRAVGVAENAGQVRGQGDCWRAESAEQVGRLAACGDAQLLALVLPDRVF